MELRKNWKTGLENPPFVYDPIETTMASSKISHCHIWLSRLPACSKLFWCSRAAPCENDALPELPVTKDRTNSSASVISRRYSSDQKSSVHRCNVFSHDNCTKKRTANMILAMSHYVQLASLSLYQSIHPSIHPSIYLSIYLSIHLSIHPSIYIYIYIRRPIYTPVWKSTPGNNYFSDSNEDLAACQVGASWPWPRKTWPHD